jgi:phosphoribosyl-AMP cyclohydrolase / phosphoribosyl-ATP pyrophosphohydrolase
LSKTLDTKKVTFFSRTKKRLWTKGESSENFLFFDQIFLDCDNDTLLIKATPAGTTCHTGSLTCFSEGSESLPFLTQLEDIIDDRFSGDDETSYVKSLQKKGQGKIVQKVGEEGVEFVIAHLHETEERLKNETADLIFHLLVALRYKKISLSDIIKVLKIRHK